MPSRQDKANRISLSWGAARIRRNVDEMLGIVRLVLACSLHISTGTCSRHNRIQIGHSDTFKHSLL